MPTVIIDLDDTLLNTAALKRDLAGSLGLSIEQWQQTYNQYTADNGVFDADGFLSGVDSNRKVAFSAIIRKMQTYLYPDSLPFIQSAQDANWDVVILTHGSKAWQQSKLDNIKFPEGVTTQVTQGNKVDVLDRLVDDQTVLIDDRAEVIEETKQRYPEFEAIWMKRRAGAHRDVQPKEYDRIIEDLNFKL